MRALQAGNQERRKRKEGGGEVKRLQAVTEAVSGKMRGGDELEQLRFM